MGQRLGTAGRHHVHDMPWVTVAPYTTSHSDLRPFGGRENSRKLRAIEKHGLPRLPYLDPWGHVGDYAIKRLPSTHTVGVQVCVYGWG